MIPEKRQFENDMNWLQAIIFIIGLPFWLLVGTYAILKGWTWK